MNSKLKKRNLNIVTISIALFASLLFSSITFAQKVKWAKKVEGFSSQYQIPNQATEYTAQQVIGRPSKMPAAGSSYCAWQPSLADNPTNEWIKVSFDTLMFIRQVSIAENLGAGSIVGVYAYDDKGKEYALPFNAMGSLKEVALMNNIVLPTMSNYLVKEIKVVLNTAKVKGWNQIDAIGISQTASPTISFINVDESALKDILKENLGKVINSKSHDVAPVISPDGKMIYYTRWDHPDNLGKDKKQDIWGAQNINGVWQDAVNMGNPINNDDNNAACSISSDGRSMYLINVYNKDGSMGKGMSVSSKTNKGWTFPRELKIKNYVNYSPFTEFSIGPSGKVLIMTAQRRDTRGGKDLYVSFLQLDSTWTEPKSMGNNVNTAEDEYTPFLASDGKTLYFSTQGHAGYGENDIFVSKRLDDTWTRWSEPMNMGPNVNTQGWDGYFTIPASGDFAYLCSQNLSLGYEDIFRLKLPDIVKPDPVAIISGTVQNSITLKPMAATVFAELINEKGDSVKIDYNPLNGDYKIILPLKKKYAIYAKQKGFLPINEYLDFSKDLNYREIKKNLYLMPIEKGTKAQLKEVVFEQGKFDLLPSSNASLNIILEMMKEAPSIEIHLDGHTDNQGDWNANLQLSENRVKAVKNYLVAKGIAESRISMKAWGGSSPISSNETENARTKNRRVEFTIKKK